MSSSHQPASPSPDRHRRLDPRPESVGTVETATRRRVLSAALHRLAREVAKFGVVGAVAFVVDVGVFNLLRLGAPGILGGLLDEKPLTAKTVSTIVATTVAYFGNRHWTFRHRGRSSLRREYALFFALNGIGLLISLSCLAFSHYVLKLTSPLADNISANGVGLALGTLFRFWSYRRFVFPELEEELVDEELMDEGLMDEELERP